MYDEKKMLRFTQGDLEYSMEMMFSYEINTVPLSKFRISNFKETLSQCVWYTDERDKRYVVILFVNKMSVNERLFCIPTSSSHTHIHTFDFISS